MSKYVNMVKVSIIIPIYNSRLYLRECLECILGQTLKEIEVICVNDGSADDSESIVKSINDDRIILINKSNEGAGSARNVGIKAARGKYVAFVDPDDLYASEDVLEKMFCKAEDNNAVICGGNILDFYDGEKPFLTDTYSKYHISEAGFKTSIEYQNPWGHTKYIFRRSFLIDNGLYYPTYRRGEDPVFMIRALDAAKEVYLFPATIYLYRQYRNRELFSSKVLIELLYGYYETMIVAFEKNNYNAFLDCARQLRYWGECIGFDEWDNNEYWSLVQTLNTLISEGKNKWNCDMTVSTIYTKKEIAQMIGDLVECLSQAKEASKKEQLYIYGAGAVAKALIEILNKVDLYDFGIVVSGETDFCLGGIVTESFQNIKNKSVYLYLIAIADENAQRAVVEKLLGEQVRKYFLVDTLVNVKGMAERVVKELRETNV